MDAQDRHLAQLKNKLQDHARLDERHRKLQDNLVDTQYGARAIEVQLHSAKSELKKLGGFSLEGLILSLMGKKTAQLAQTRQACEQLEQQYCECEESLEQLEREVAGLENEIEASGNSEAEYHSLMATKQDQILRGGDEAAERLRQLSEESQAARATIEAVRKVIAARKEAWSDLRSEVEVISTLGRCRVSEGCGGIEMIMNASRKGTAEQCASRVRQALGRLERRLNEVIDGQNALAGDDLTELDRHLAHYGDNFSGGGFFKGARAGESVDDVANLLCGAEGVLDERLVAAERRAAAVEERMQAFILAT